VKHELIIVRYGEIALKGKATRKYFENRLIKNIQDMLNKSHIPHKIKKEWGRIYVYTDRLNESIDLLKKIFGIVSISPTFQTKSNIELMTQHSINILKEKLTKGKTFALRVTRTGEHDFTSQDAAIKIGNAIVKTTKANVDLTKPDFELFIEIRNENAYLFTNKIRGTGGLPLGTQGKVLALIDSPESILAAWYLMRRGCIAVFVTTEKTYNKQLNSIISNWDAPLEIISVEDHGKNLCKKLNETASGHDCDAVVTGHTLTSLPDIKLLKKYIKCPILYPLVAMEENELNEKCKELGITK